MGFNFYSADRPCFVWELNLPSTYTESKSPIFKLENSSWEFEFKSRFKLRPNTEKWSISLRKVSQEKVFGTFSISTYFENINGVLQDLGLPSKVNFENYGTSLFNNRVSHSDIAFDKPLKLVFMVSLDYQHVADITSKNRGAPADLQQKEDRSKEQKLIQTPNWMDVQPCMKSLSVDFKKLLDDDSQHDVKLNCNDHTLHAHSLILSARSEVFSAMLQSDMLEKTSGSIDIVDMEFPVLDQFIKYLYSGNLGELTIDTAMQLYETSDKYCVAALRKRCGEFLKEYLNEENACRLLILADSHSDQDLKEYTISFIIDREIPQKDDKWDNFCKNHPNVAIDVLNKAYKNLKPATR